MNTDPYSRRLSACRAAYRVLAPAQHQWAGRYTVEGQRTLAELRDVIAQGMNADPVRVQLAYEALEPIAGPPAPPDTDWGPDV